MRSEQCMVVLSYRRTDVPCHDSVLPDKGVSSDYQQDWGRVGYRVLCCLLRSDFVFLRW